METYCIFNFIEEIKKDGLLSNINKNIMTRVQSLIIHSQNMEKIIGKLNRFLICLKKWDRTRLQGGTLLRMKFENNMLLERIGQHDTFIIQSMKFN